MGIKTWTKKRIFSIFNFTILNFILFSNLTLLSFASNDVKNNDNENLISQNKTRYLLGPGDIIRLKIHKLESYGATLKVLPDGTINLPRLGSIEVNGLTIDEVQKKIQVSYKSILRKPIIYVDLITTRPIRIAITGEIQKPGIYSINVKDNAQLINTDDGEALNVSLQGWPTLFEAIQKAGGLKPNANIKNIQIYRYIDNNPKTINANLWRIFDKNSSFYNPPLFDNDKIFIGKGNNSGEKELLDIAESNLAPSNITVNVIGEVKRPGRQLIKANSPVSSALLNAGGLTRNANSSKLFHLRLTTEGQLIKKNFKFDHKSLVSNANFLMKDGDVIVVSEGSLSKTTKRINDLTAPINPILNSVSLIKLLNLD